MGTWRAPDLRWGGVGQAVFSTLTINTANTQALRIRVYPNGVLTCTLNGVSESIVDTEMAGITDWSSSLAKAIGGDPLGVFADFDGTLTDVLVNFTGTLWDSAELALLTAEVNARYDRAFVTV